MHRFYVQVDKGELKEVTGLKCFTFGRVRFNQKENKFLLNDRSVSATHCTILVVDNPQNPHFWVFDGNAKFGSKNGTVVNGMRVLRGNSSIELERGCQIYHGDFILIADHKINFIISRDAEDEDGTV